MLACYDEYMPVQNHSDCILWESVIFSGQWSVIAADVLLRHQISLPQFKRPDRFPSSEGGDL